MLAVMAALWRPAESIPLDTWVRAVGLRAWRGAVLFTAGLLVASQALAADEATFKLVARDGVFTPALIEVPAGKRVRLEVTNEGKTPVEFESRDLKQEKVIPPGGK